MSVSPTRIAAPQPPVASGSGLPEGWAVSHLGEVVAPSKEKVEPHAVPDAPYLSLEHVESNTSRIVGNGYSQDVKSTKSVFRTGDVIYGKLRPYLNKVAVPSFDGICSTDFLVFPEMDGLESRLLLWFLSGPKVVEYANHHSSGLALPRVKFDALAQLDFPLPPLAEQHRIVAKVEALLAHVNAARERLARVPKILKAFRQSVLAAACSGRLTEDWREAHPGVESASLLLSLRRIEAQRPIPTNSRSAKVTSAVESLTDDDLPKSWMRASFERLTLNFDGRRVPVKQEDRARRRGVYPYYGASGIIDTIDDFLFDGQYLLISEDGANLLMRSTPIAFQASGQFWVNNHAHIVQACAGMPLQYLEIYLNGIDLQEYVTGSAQPKLTQANLNRIPITLPPLEEQHEIVRRVEALFQLADTIEKRVEAATHHADKLTQAILAKAFRGELVPTEAELARREGRDYEPASVLLERIKAEQTAKAGGRETKRPRGRKRSKKSRSEDRPE